MPLQLEAPLLLLPPEVWPVGLDNVEDGEVVSDGDDDDDDDTEDNDGGRGGNDIDVDEGPTLQNL